MVVFVDCYVDLRAEMPISVPVFSSVPLGFSLRHQRSLIEVSSCENF